MSWSDDLVQIRIVGVDGRVAAEVPQSREAPAPRPGRRMGGRSFPATASYGVNRAHSGIYAVDPGGGGSRWLAAPTKPTAAVELARRTGSDKFVRPAPGSARLVLPSVALSSRYLVAEERRRDRGHVLERYDVSRGVVLGTTVVPKSAGPISLSGDRRPCIASGAGSASGCQERPCPPVALRPYEQEWTGDPRQPRLLGGGLPRVAAAYTGNRAQLGDRWCRARWNRQPQPGTPPQDLHSPVPFRCGSGPHGLSNS